MISFDNVCIIIDTVLIVNMKFILPVNVVVKWLLKFLRRVITHFSNITREFHFS